MSKFRRGFTLMEVLLVSCLLAVVGAVIFQVFHNGFKLWQYADRLGRQQDAVIALDKIGEDTRSILPVSGIAFHGTSLQCSFPSIILTSADKRGSRAGEGLIDQIGAVQYRFDPAEGKLYRRQANYGQALKNQWGPDAEVASGIEEWTFSYTLDGQRAGTEKSTMEKIPSGITARWRMKGTAPDHWFKRYFMIPVGD